MSGTETTESSTYLFPLLLTFIIRLRSTFALYLLLKFSFSSQLRHKFPSLSPLLTSIHLLPLHAGLVLLASPSPPLPCPPPLSTLLPSFICLSPPSLSFTYLYLQSALLLHFLVYCCTLGNCGSPSYSHKVSQHTHRHTA